MPSTAGWSREYRDKILNELNESGDPEEVAVANGIGVTQVLKCLTRERYEVRRRVAGAEREQFIAELDKRARMKLLSALDKAEGSDDPKDQLRLIDLCRKLLEGTGTIQRPKQDGPPQATQVILQVDAEKAQFNLEHVGKLELQERAKKLLGGSHGDTESQG